MAGRECGAAAAETALREKLFSDVVDGEEVPENKREVFECVVDDILSFAPDRAAAGNFFPRFFQNHKTRHTSHTFRTVQGLLERTILHGEGNSLLVIGPRGSGKTWVVERVFRELHKDKRCRDNYIRVYLNGIVLTDDRLTLLEIARQLNCAGDYLEQQTSLSFAAALEYILAALRSGSRANKSVIFVLDEFDQFTCHKNQSLLYNLFDISQSPHNPIAVVGLTCRLDVVELLEKRVKSRFSHRQLLLFPHTEFTGYVALARSLLSLPHDFKPRQYQLQWQKQLEELLQDATVLKALQRQFRISADVRSLKTLLLFPVSRLGSAHPYLSPSDFPLSLDLLHKDSLTALLNGLSVLELCLLVAVRQVTEVNSGELFNFQMVYSEYKKFAQRAQSVDVFSHPVALKAFDHLLAMELLLPVTEHSARQAQQQMREYVSVHSVLDSEQICKAVQTYPNCPTDLVRWASTQPTA